MKLRQSDNQKPEQGMVIISILVVMMFLITIIFSLIILSNSNLVRARNRVLLLQAQYAAESGVDTAIAQFNSGNVGYGGTTSDTEVLNNNLYKATFAVSVAPGANDKEKIITATGKVYSPKSSASPTQTRTIEVLSQRSSTTATSAIVGRNIIELESGVKNVIGRDVFANGYIKINKTTTSLIAESITVADKRTGAANCSIEGPHEDNLKKPATFTNPGQSKTKITTAYNNCVSPPGNTSNAYFDVLANQTNISKVQSTLIPWSYYMDNTYQNAPGDCNDWISGSFPRDIPSTGNTKKTHYPDNGSNVNNTCGTSGNLMLDNGQYNILDHAHLRANLCGSTGCEATFHNPDTGPGSVKYIFIEGTINFDSLQTTPSSGPIVFVSYGADPSYLAGVCPLGGSIYLSNDGTTTAPQAYLLAQNGICLDKTRFGANPALGGLSGKNLYIATNPGTPFDLRLDPAFPVGEIPIDLAWRAVRYHRR